jgi:ATP-dependent RNA helicase DDX23/PRP28
LAPTGPSSYAAPADGISDGSSRNTPDVDGSIGASAVPPTSAELDIIRARYLGASTVAAAAGPSHGPKKPRARKLQDKKFVFDWDASDDTTSGEVGTWRDKLARGEMDGVPYELAARAGAASGGTEGGAGIAGGGTMFGGRLAGYDEGGRRRGVIAGAGDK